jgi:2-polyprenyl-3-methyl-5-hydroxy-6-metoxy-1,4-benzoquinol methylase
VALVNTGKTSMEQITAYRKTDNVNTATVLPKRQIDLEFEYIQTGMIQAGLSASDTHELDPNCECCGNPTENFLSVCNRHGEVILKKSFCMRCGHMSYKRAPDEAWFSRYYSQVWRQSTTKKTSRASDVDKILKGHLVDKSVNILEFGCGYGSALANLQESGYLNCHGIEPSGTSAEYSQSRGLDVIQGQANECHSHPNAPFDVIFSRHVLEHVIDLEDTLNSIKEAVKPGGLVYLSVPNIEFEDVVSAAHYIPHYRQFSALSLACLLDKSGFSIIESDQSTRTLFIVAKKGKTNPALLADEFETINQNVMVGMAHKISRELFDDDIPKKDEGSFRQSRHKSGRINFDNMDTPGALQMIDQSVCRILYNLGFNPVSPHSDYPLGRRAHPQNIGCAVMQRLRKFELLEIGGRYRIADIPEGQNFEVRITHNTDQVFAWAL